MKKMRGLGLVLALTLTFTSTAFGAVTLPDINTSIYKEAIQTLVDAEIVVGDEDGKFHPEKNLTRAEACIMIVKTIAPEIEATESTVKKTVFKDMDESYLWADPFVAYAVEQGIVVGYPGNLFKPAKNVTTNELLTMILGASGYAGKIEGAWPEAYVEKAKAVGVLDKLEVGYPSVATKGMAAQMIANKMDAMKSETDEESGSSEGVLDSINKEKLVFGDGSFDKAASTYDGKTIGKNVKVYSYGIEKEYNKNMDLSSKIGDYFEETVHKYRNVETPVWYAVENGKITMMIVPRDTGFSGRVYGVINGTYLTINGDNEGVVAFETLAAKNEVNWLGKEDLDYSAYTDATAGDGTLFELRTRDGEVQSVTTSGALAEDRCKELTTAKTWTTVGAIDADRELISVEGIGYYEVSETPSVYVWDEDDGIYNVGNLRNIKKGDFVRLYDITDDDENIAEIILVKK